MNWKTCAMLLLLIAMRAAVAQDAAPAQTPPPQIERETVVVHRGWPPFHFEIIPMPAKTWEESDLVIKITGGPKAFRGQTITTYLARPDEPGFDTGDVNFDGYTDFSLVYEYAGDGNTGHTYWVFDPRRLIFKHATVFDGITYIDAKHHLLISGSRAGPDSLEQFYRLENSRPALIKSIERISTEDARGIVPLDYKYLGVAITRLYVHGKLRRTFYHQTDE